MEGKLKIDSGNSKEAANYKMFGQNSWVNFTVLDIGAGYRVKRIEVLPRRLLRFQNNKFYAEHWTVVQGTAKITTKDRTFSVRTGETMEFAINETHYVENPDQTEILVFIDVQCGFSVMENEFGRFSDEYDMAADVAE